MRRRRVPLAGCLVLSALAALVACSARGSSEEMGTVSAALTAGDDRVVISQIYGGGALTGATYNADYVELFNRGTTSASLAGASLQYRSAAGTGDFHVFAVLDDVTLAPGAYYLVRLKTGASGVDLTVVADQVGTQDLAATAGRVLLSSGATDVACGQQCAGAATVLDLVGYGSTALDFEGAPAPNPSNAKAVVRKGGGCIDTDHNDADFEAIAAGNVHNASTPAVVCGEPVDAGADADAGDAGDAGDMDAGDAGDAGADADADAGDAGRPDAGDAGTDASTPPDSGATPKDAGKSGVIDDWVPQPAPAVGDGCGVTGGATSTLGLFAGLASVLGLAARRRRLRKTTR